MDKPKRRWWQFGLREALIATGGLGAELAIMRPLFLYSGPPLSDGLVNLMAGFAVFFLLGLPIGVTAGLIARRWKVAIWGTFIAMVIWFGSLWLVASFDFWWRATYRP